MKFGLCAAYGDVAALDPIPCDYLEVNVQHFLAPEQAPDVFADNWRQARALPIPIEAANGLLPPDMVLIETPERAMDVGRLERYMKTTLERAARVGIGVIVFGSGAARACPAGVDHAEAVRRIGEHLATWSVWARDHDVRIALEPLRYEETNTLNTVAEGGALVQSIASSGATLLADLYHMACNGEPAGSLPPWAPLLSHVHVAERRDRAAPGRYGDDFGPYFAALHQAGYGHRISIECRWQDFAGEAGPAIARLKQQWSASAGQKG
jgi:sugar phosphate isomerase/epimerase